MSSLSWANASGTAINMSVGALGAVGTGSYTIVALVNPNGANFGAIALKVSTGNDVQIISDTNTWFGGADFSAGFSGTPGSEVPGDWQVIGQSKSSGTNVYRWHYWDYTTNSSKVHQDGTGTHANPGTITAITLGLGDNFGAVSIAAAAVWKRVLSDAEFNSLCTSNLSDWMAVSGGQPDAIWACNVAAASVVDGTGNGADASSVTGTVTLTGSDPPSFNYSLAAASIPYNPQRSVQLRDPGETWWIQRDRRDANTVATAANPLPSPLDVAFGAGGPYWHLYNDAADAAPRTWMAQQRTYSDPSLLSPPATMPAPTPQRTVAVRDYGEAQWLQGARHDPLLLTTAQLENELLGSVDDLARHRHAGVYTDRREVPQQRPYVSDPLLLTTAELENELLGSVDDLRRRQLEAVYWPDRREVPQQRAYISDPAFYPVPNPPDITTSGLVPLWLARNVAATHTDRREVPQQRLYISDPSFYPTAAPTDPLTVAWGVGGHYWLLYNQAALDVDRREVPQQRPYVSDPSLLTTALLEGPLLGGADTGRHLTWFVDRREVPQQRVYTDPAELASALLEDPLLGWADTDRHRTWFTDRRLVPQQPPRAFDPNLLTTALLEGALLGSGDTARHAMWFTDRRSVPQQPPRLTPAAGVLADPTALTGDRWFRILLPATHVDRRETVPQRIALVFVGAAAPPVVKATSTSAVSAGRTSVSGVTAGRTSTAAVTARRTSTGGVT